MRSLKGKNVYSYFDGGGEMNALMREKDYL